MQIKTENLKNKYMYNRINEKQKFWNKINNLFEKWVKLDHFRFSDENLYRALIIFYFQTYKLPVIVAYQMVT